MSFAEDFANFAEAAMSEGLKEMESIQVADNHMSQVEVSGAVKNAAYTILTKCWEYGDDLQEYFIKKYDFEDANEAYGEKSR